MKTGLSILATVLAMICAKYVKALVLEPKPLPPLASNAIPPARSYQPARNYQETASKPVYITKAKRSTFSQSGR